MFFFLKKAYIKRTLKRNALRKGLLGGSPLWRAVWAGQLLLKGWGKVSKGGEAPITFTEPLKQGEAWALVHEPEQSRKGRGEGRKLLVGPKRKAPRASALTGVALGTIGKRLIEAPSADRINEILGADVVEQPAPSRSQRRAAKNAAKSDAKSASKTAKSDAKSASKTAKSDAKSASKTAKSDAKSASKTAKSDAKSASKTTKTSSRKSRKAARADTTRADATQAIVATPESEASGEIDL